MTKREANAIATALQLCAKPHLPAEAYNELVGRIAEIAGGLVEKRLSASAMAAFREAAYPVRPTQEPNS